MSYRGMKKDVLGKIESSMAMRSLKKNCVLNFPQLTDKYLFYLKVGLLKVVTIDDEGNEVIKSLIKPGMLFGELSFLDEKECKEDYALALQECTIGFIDTSKMKQFVETDPEVRAVVAEQIAQRIHRLEKRLVSISSKSAYHRICDFVGEFAKEFGGITPYGYEVKNLLTHEEIAKLTTTSRQTVSSTLSRLRSQKLIEYNNEHIKIPFTSSLLNNK